ncbi:hypothetical protein ElyMa_001078600 [Elysia marginata]|uniref:Uncharacterized protein n=1 Tax=Elysia marginata TaxID=1093978 RepID=A0AAV4HTE3_9GAST|nr:hypothetical protein ElyMa_001078600 [Elysia marginata]
MYESLSTPIHPAPLPRQDKRRKSGLKSIKRSGDFTKCYEKLTQDRVQGWKVGASFESSRSSPNKAVKSDPIQQPKQYPQKIPPQGGLLTPIVT